METLCFRNSAFLQNFHTSKLGEITVFFAVNVFVPEKSNRKNYRCRMKWRNEYLDETYPVFSLQYYSFTESLKGHRINPYGFYLITLPQGIRWALMRYHIKLLGMTKTQGFRRDLYWYDFTPVFTPVEIVWTLQRYGIELKDILKNPTDFYGNHHDCPIKGC